MNLIELENLVKGAPDEYLVKEVQQPTGKVPPFLALSEIQRRKDMRDRYMAQTNEGPKPTIAEQLVGGIGSMGGAQPPQGAPIPTPSATGIPSVGAPPVAAGAAPMPTPQGMPQGFAAGGIVKLATGKEVPPYLSFLNPMTDAQRADYERRKAMPSSLHPLTGDPVSPFMADPMQLAQQRLARALSAGTGVKEAKIAIKELEDFEKARNTPAKYVPNRKLPFEIEKRKTSNIDYLFSNDAPAAVPAEASVPAPVSNRPGPLPAPADGASGSGGSGGAGGAPRSGGGGGYAVTSVGIGSIDPNQVLAGPSGPAPSGGQAPKAGIPNPYNVSEPELALEEYLKNDKNFVLPEALSYQAFIDEAVGEEQKIREEAKRQAIGAALVQLGAGLASGDMAKGFTTAGAESRDILSQGRKEASAQKALAQQFKLQGMEGERDVKLKQMDMDLKRTEGLATLVGGNRRAAEERAMQIARMQQDASQHAASIGVQYGQLQISAERAVLEKKQGAMQFMENLIETSGIKAPTQARLDEWAIANRTNPATAGPNPMDTYMAQRAAAAKLAAPKVERVYGIPAQDLYIDAVKPVSNPPQSGWGITKLPGK